MHILIAPNAFKNSLGAMEAAKAIGEGLRQSKLKCTMEYFPVGDGGDGTADLILKRHMAEIMNVQVQDALGKQVVASIGLIDNRCTAIIELADASGLKLLQPNALRPLHATTYGTGELMRSAVDNGVSRIILCVGGSATIDGGTGILQALGIKFLDKKNKILNGLPGNLVHLAAVDLSGLDKKMHDCELIILCDVEIQLLGKSGAAKIYGPQKGASEEDIIKLEASLTQLCKITLQQTGKDMAAFKYGGAAGGVAAGLALFLNAQLINGINYFLTIPAFDEALQGADLVITGEGSIDAQTLQGKGPYGVALRAKDKNIPVIGIAGKVPLESDDQLRKYFDVLLSINNEPLGLPDAICFTKQNLVRTSRTLGDLLAMQRHKQK